MDKQAIIDKLRANASSIVLQRMDQKGGDSFCASYIQANMEKHKCSFEVALGWLEQEIAEVG